jgi:MFS family permease
VAAAIPVSLAVFLGPSCNAALFGYQAAITPEHLQGRVLSVILLAAMSASAAAPLLSGLFVTAWGPARTILVFAASVSVAALTATLAAGIRTMRPIEEAAPT